MQLAKYCKQFGAITALPNIAALVPASISTGLLLQGDVGLKTISLKLDGKPLKTLLSGAYTFVVSDRSAKQNFHLKGPGLNKSTGARQVGRLSFTTTLAKGRYTYFSDANPSLRGTFTVG